jgi:hypothetical protein
MLEKRRLKESKIEQTQLEKEKERIETARAKEKTREMRLAIMEAQFQANKQQVKKRIMQKQEEWSKRHEFNLEEIRKKAFEMSVLRFSSEDHNSGEAPTPVPYEKPKYCSVCSVVIGSELQLKSHLRGVKHQEKMNETNQGKNLTKTEVEEYNLNCIIDLPKESSYEKELLLDLERRKIMKKRVKKLRNKILAKTGELENMRKGDEKTTTSLSTSSASSKSKVPKLLKEMEKILNATDRFNPNIDRNCGELNRILQKNSNEQLLFFNLNGPSTCVGLLELLNNVNTQQQQQQQQSYFNETTSSNVTRTTLNLAILLTSSVRNFPKSCAEFILSDKLLSLIEILQVHSSTMLSEINSGVSESHSGSGNNKNVQQQKIANKWLVCSALFQLIGCIFSSPEANLKSSNEPTPAAEELANLNSIFVQRAHDYIRLVIYVIDIYNRLKFSDNKDFKFQVNSRPMNNSLINLDRSFLKLFC